MAKFAVLLGILIAAALFAWLGVNEPSPHELPAGTCDLIPFLCVR